MNIPNTITLFRLLITPFIAYCLYYNTPVSIAMSLVLFLIGCVSDTVDGAVARSFGQMSKLGAILDHTADKVLILTTLVMLVFLGHLKDSSLIAVFLILLRDLILGGLREAAAMSHLVIAPNWLGKMKTIMQMVSISLLIGSYFLKILYPIGLILLWLSAVLSIMSFVSYLVFFVQKRQ